MSYQVPSRTVIKNQLERVIFAHPVMMQEIIECIEKEQARSAMQERFFSSAPMSFRPDPADFIVRGGI